MQTAVVNGGLIIQTPEAGGPYTIHIEGKNVIELTDVLIGEVWLASGQSNMAWPMNRSDHAEEEIAAADYPNIRLFTVSRDVASTPRLDCKGEWTACKPESVRSFSAVAYYFARKLQKKPGCSGCHHSFVLGRNTFRSLDQPPCPRSPSGIFGIAEKI